MNCHRHICILLLPLVLISLISCAKPERLPLGNMNFGWESDYDSIAQIVSYNNRWVGHGWWYGDDNGKGSSVDFSEYDRVVVELDSISAGITKMGVSIQYSNTEESTWVVSPVVGTRMTLRADLDPDLKTHVREIYIQSSRVGSVHIADAYLAHRVRYGEPKKLVIDNGFIYADQFEGLSDDAIIEFNYKVFGQLSAVDDDGKTITMKNWSIGIISSLADIMEAEVPCRYIPVTGIGDITYRCYMSDIRYMLQLKDDDGLQGLYWNIWKMGNITKAYPVSAVVRDVKKTNL